MIHEHEHPSFELLSDLADETLSATDRTRVQAHLVRCAECAERLARLRRLIEAVSALPADVSPPRELWPDIQARIATPITSTPAPTTRTLNDRARSAAQRLAGRPWMLAAAALVLVAVTSVITAALVRHPTTLVVQTVVPQPTPVRARESVARGITAEYASTAQLLAEGLASQRTKLDPTTIAKVEASLRVIDDAIAEAQRALADDPANMTLVDILSANYERKLELLRRATELPSST